MLKMKLDFNFLITCRRGDEFSAVHEAKMVFEEIGDKEVSAVETGIKGLIALKTELDPLKAVESIKKLMRDSPHLFLFTFRFIPIQRKVKTDLEEIKRAVSELGSQIGDKETFRVTVEKRRTSLHSKEVIEAAASLIDRKVNLKNPDKVVLVEIIGEYTGISILKPSQILSTMKGTWK